MMTKVLLLFSVLVLVPLVRASFSILPENQLYYSRRGGASLEEAIAFCSAIGGEAPFDLTTDLIQKIVDSSVLQPVLPLPYRFFWLNAANNSDDGLYRWTESTKLIDGKLWAANEPTCADDNVCVVTIESRGKLYAEPDDRERDILCHVDANDQGKRLRLKINLDVIPEWSDRQGIGKFLKKLED